MGFRNPLTSADGVDTGGTAGYVRIHDTAGPIPGKEGGIIELGTTNGNGLVEAFSSAHGSGVRVAGRTITSPLEELPADGQSVLTLADTEQDGTAAAELKSAGNVRLSPAAGYGVNTNGRPLTAGAFSSTDLSNFRFIPPTLVLTDANARATYNFPVPFPSTCWFVQAAPTGDFGYSFNWSVVSWTRTGCVIRAGKNDGTLLPSTSLFVQLWAAGV